MEFSKEVKELFLKGGAIVHSDTYTTNTYLIRMPKGQFIKDDRKEWKNNFFEYVIAGDYYGDDSIDTETHLNSTLGGAKKRMILNHSEKCSAIWNKENK
tara:strand:+ start:207 stop:503 length:297 start_codon:yes stop_codon:yes gene_type:complete